MQNSNNNNNNVSASFIRKISRSAVSIHTLGDGELKAITIRPVSSNIGPPIFPLLRQNSVKKPKWRSSLLSQSLIGFLTSVCTYQVFPTPTDEQRRGQGEKEARILILYSHKIFWKLCRECPSRCTCAKASWDYGKMIAAFLEQNRIEQNSYYIVTHTIYKHFIRGHKSQTQPKVMHNMLLQVLHNNTKCFLLSLCCLFFHFFGLFPFFFTSLSVLYSSAQQVLLSVSPFIHTFLCESVIKRRVCWSNGNTVIC